MSRQWFTAYHPECDDCVWDPVTDDRESVYDYYWIRSVRKCRGRVCHFNMILMPPGAGRQGRVARICTASYHGNVVHVHIEMGHNRGQAATDIPCTPEHLDDALGMVDYFILRHDEQKIAQWKAETWVHALQSL